MSATRPTSRERAHFAAVARAMAAEKPQQIAQAALDESANGIAIGLELAVLAGESLTIGEMERERAAGQVELRRRWLRVRGRTG